MRLFGKKNETKDEPKLDFVTRKARKRLLAQAQKAIYKSYKQGRLVFIGGEAVSYTEKSGKKHTFTIEACANMIYRKLNDEFSGTMGAFGAAGAGLASLYVFSQDIKEIIIKLKEEVKK